MRKGAAWRLARRYHRDVAMWHCPHCGAPQAETARCWVCRRSSTTCSTCRHFRPSLASDIGYCALDRARRPLTGLELRGCWTQRPAAAVGEASAAVRGAPESGALRESVQARGFVPLDDVAPVARIAQGAPDPDASIAPPVLLLTSLFGDLDR